jgi:2-dehydropantoate 2-reductase
LEPRLNWLIFGAGAIGTYIGGSLLLRGHKVTFIEQAKPASEILEHGLRLNIYGQENRILHPDMITDIPQAIRKNHFDILIFALKAYDTQAALEAIYPYTDRLPPVLCIQNGVENETQIEAIMGKDKVIAGTVTSSISRRAAGDVVLERLRGMGIVSGHPLSNTLAQVLTESGLNAHLIPSAAGMKWSKMLTNLLANASSAILDMTPSEILHHPKLYELEIAQVREAIRVMQAHQIPIIDLPGVQVKYFSCLVQNISPRVSRLLLARLAGGGRGQKMPSFHIDLHSGRGNSEVDYLNGAVVRFGRQVNIPTPVNQWLAQTLTSLVQGKLPLELYSHQPDKYVLALKSFIGSQQSHA